MEQKEAWNSFYAANGRPWRGVSKIDVPFPEGSRILELGCGNGKTAAALSDAGMRVTALDFSEKAIEACAECGKDIEFLCADVTELPFGDGTFDGALAYHVLEHLDAVQLSKAVSELRRVLKPGAHVLVRAFSTDDMRSGKGKKTGDGTVERGNGIVYRYFTEEMLLRAFDSFECVSIGTVSEETRFGTVRSRIEADFGVFPRP